MDFLFRKKEVSDYTYKEMARDVKYTRILINLTSVFLWFVLQHLYVHTLISLNNKQQPCIDAKSSNEIPVFSPSENKKIWVSATDAQIKAFCEKEINDDYWECHLLSLPLTLMLILTIKYSIFEFTLNKIKSKLNERVGSPHIGHMLQTREKDK